MLTEFCVRCVTSIAIGVLPHLGWSADSSPPFTLQVEATQDGIVVTATAANSEGNDLLPVKELGRCSAQIWVTADGYIRVAQIIKTSGHSRLDDACLRGVAGKRMLPSRDDKAPIDAWMVLPVIWRAHMSTEPRPADRLDMPIAALDTRQSLPVKSVDYPKRALERSEQGDVFLHVGISDSGRVLVVRVSQSSGSADLDNAALAAIRAAQFKPASRDQKAVASTTDVVVSWILPGMSTPLASPEHANPKP